MTGWREGTVHYRSGSGYDENKGSGHAPGGDECEDCHAYDSVNNHQNGSNYLLSGNGTAYTVTMGYQRFEPGLVLAPQAVATIPVAPVQRMQL